MVHQFKLKKPLSSLVSIAVLTVVISLFPSLCFGQTRPYTLLDLEVLESEKNTEEFFKHYREIRPSERQKRWREITQNMGILWIQNSIKEKKFSREHFQLLEERTKGSPFAEDEHFQHYKRQYLTHYFDSCFENKHAHCHEHLEKALMNTILESEWSYQFVTKHLNLLKTNELKILIKSVLQSSDGEIYCGKLSFFTPLLNLYIEEKVHQDELQKNITKELITSNCRKKLKEQIQSHLFEIPRYKRLDAFLFLDELKLLSPETKEIFYVIYTLDIAEIGDTLNLAWNFVQSLGENYQKRKKILEKLLKLKTLPGETIFKTPDYDRHQAIIKLFKKNFPEYLDHYASSCLKFLNGGNSEQKVLNCHEFFTTNEIEQKWKDSYLKLKNSIERNSKSNK